MTWQTKVVRVALVVGVLGGLALAFGANYLDGIDLSWLGF
jgi:hypothetical protein